MSQLISTRLREIEDGYERYYTEKLWHWIPEVYRNEDGKKRLDGSPSNTLRSFVRILAREAVISRRSIDRLWEDTIIDYADDWAVPYIGDLVGTRLLNARNRKGRRVDVARTVEYRTRAGTPSLLEELIHDITGWHGVVHEAFRRLARTRHNLDPVPGSEPGFPRRTPPGGTADLRSPRILELLDGPFDEYAHTPDFRRLEGFKGRYNIPKLNVHLYRQLAFEVSLATPFQLDPVHFTFDPSGRDITLFKPSQRPYRSPPGDSIRKLVEPECHSAREWEMPGPLTCRLLNEAWYLPTIENIPNILAPLLGVLFNQLMEGTSQFRRLYQRLLQGAAPDWNSFANALQGSMLPASPKSRLIPEAVALTRGNDPHQDPLEPARITGANLEAWAGFTLPPEVSTAIDPGRGRFLIRNALPNGQTIFSQRYHYGQFYGVGAGTYDRQQFLSACDGDFPETDGMVHPTDYVDLGALPITGSRCFTTSKTYRSDVSEINGVHSLRLQAGNYQRPYFRVRPAGGGSDFVINTEPLMGPSVAPENKVFEMDGVWLGMVPETVAPQVRPDADTPPDPVAAQLVLEGYFERVNLCHVTLDPGGEQARINPQLATAIPYITLVLRGQIRELTIDRSIVGPIVEEISENDPCSVGKIIIRDSIVQSIDNLPAIQTRIGAVHIERSTIFGNVIVNELEATETLVQGVVRVTNNQDGCFRFSAADANGKDHNGNPISSSFPPRFESHVFEKGIANHVFLSRRFGDPGYSQLSETAPIQIVRGGENTSEIGVFNKVLEPIKKDDLRAKFSEYAPISMIPQFINET